MLLTGTRLQSWAAAELVSISTGNEISSSSDSFNGSVDASGRYVVFDSSSPELVPPDFFSFQDVFLRDRQLGVTTRISMSSDSDGPDGSSYAPVISADGRWIVFVSDATNLVGNDTNGQSDVFLCDRLSGKITRVSVGAGGVQSNGFSNQCVVSANGRFVAFVSAGNNLVSEDNNNSPDVFVRDIQAGTTKRVNVSTSGTEMAAGNSASLPQLSYDGRWVVFASDAANLVNGHTGSTTDIFLHDRVEHSTILVSKTQAGVQGNGHSTKPSISGDGSNIAFESNAPNLVGGGGLGHVIIVDRISGTVRKPRSAASYSYSPSLNADGSRIALVANLGASDELEVIQRSFNDLNNQSYQPTRTAGGAYTGAAFSPSLSGDGRLVVFSSAGNNIDPRDNNGEIDVFARPLADTVGFTKAVYHGDEGSSVTVVVQRDGLVAGAISVSYTIGLGGDTAARIEDYTTGSTGGTWNWAAGDFSTRSLTFPLPNDTEPDGTKVFTISLNNASPDVILGTDAAVVAIRDNDSDPIENHIGHGLMISKIVSRGTNWDTGVFRALITITNPSSLPSFPGEVDFQFNGFSIGTQAFNGIPAGGSVTLDMVTNVGGGPDGKVFAILNEFTDDGTIAQDSALAAGFIDNGTAPPTGGTAPPNLGTTAPGVTPVTLKTVAVNGVATVNEGTSAAYTVTAKLSDGTTIPNVSPVWKASLFSVSQSGLFSAGDVAADKAVKISATVTKNGVTVTGSKSVTVKNVPAVPIINSSLVQLGTTGKPFSYRITARHEPTSFTATNLPTGLEVNTATGVISGVPAASGNSNVQIQATNAQGTDTEFLQIQIFDPSPITINIIGSGVVGPVTNGQVLDVGRFYKISAKPDPGFLFAGWSNGFTSVAATITFQMAANLTLNATFVANPFLTRNGTYAGILEGTPGGHEGSGIVIASINKTGVCSGKVTLGAKAYSFKLTLAPDGVFRSVSIPRKNLPPIELVVALDTGGATPLLAGGLSIGDELHADIDAARAMSDVSSIAGYYTAVMPTEEVPHAGGEIPDGSGFGAFTVKKNGRTSFVGRMGDGTPVTHAGFITDGFGWSLYAPLYSKGGSVSGGIFFSDNPISDATAILRWFKPVRPKDAVYPNGWPAGLPVEFYAASYSQPPVIPGLDAPDSDGNAVAYAVGGGLVTQFTQRMNLADNGGVSLLQPIFPRFSLRLTSRTGLFSGTFSDPVTGKLLKFSGAVQQKDEAGYGFFTGLGQKTGYLILSGD